MVKSSGVLVLGRGKQLQVTWCPSSSGHVQGETFSCIMSSWILFIQCVINRLIYYPFLKLKVSHLHLQLIEFVHVNFCVILHKPLIFDASLLNSIITSPNLIFPAPELEWNQPFFQGALVSAKIVFRT